MLAKTVVSTQLLAPAFLLFAASAGLLASGLLTRSQQQSPEAQIRPLMARLDSAGTRDPSLVQHLYADSFYAVVGAGRLLRKPEWLTLRAGLRIHTAEWEDMHFFDYGSTVLVVGIVHRTYDMPDARPVDERRRATYVWVNRNGRWQLAATHGTPLRQ